MATVTAAVGSIKGMTPATVVRPTPRFLYAASNGPNGAITAFRVDPATGSLTAIGTPYSTTNNPVSLAVTRDSKFLYVAENSGYVSARAIQADGSLVPIPGSPFPNPDTPTGVVAHPTADFLYVSTKAGVTVYEYDPASGTPTLTSSVVIGDFSTQLAVIAPDGSHFYQTVFGPASIAGFSVDSASGALSALPGGPVWGPCINPEAPYAYVPTQVALDPTGKFLYAAIEGGFQPAYCALYSFPGYSIDPASGAMTEMPVSPFAAGENPVTVAVEASGRFLFVGNGGGISNSGGSAPIGVSVYSINPDTGVPTEIAGSPFATASIPGFVVADPSASYLYVGTGTGILGFTIDQVTGALKANPGATAAVGNVQFIAVTH
jgi:6-phosphogluconolactonase (cycloisomerase 2 family)